jgi:uncharacterized protein YdcH (DUF465 family)
MGEKELKETLMKKNKEFKKVVELHQKYDTELEKLESKNYLSDDEKIKIRELKKKKLVLKDKMYLMMAKYLQYSQ